MLVILLFLLSASIVVASLGVLVRIITRIKTSRHSTVIAEYEAPKFLTPAELGYLFDNRFGDSEVLATVISLVQKGYLQLKQAGSGDPDIVLTHKHQDTKALDSAELTVLSWIRVQKSHMLSWKSFAGVVSETLGAHQSFHEEVKLQLVQKGFIKRSSIYTILQKDYITLISTLITGVIGVVLALFYQAYILANFPEGYATVFYAVAFFSLVPIVVIVWVITAFYTRLLFLLFARTAGRPLNTTGLFRHRWKDIAGYHTFLSTVEFSRLDADPNIMDSSLPYAIALGFRPDIDSLVASSVKN